MASLKTLRVRIKSIKSTQKITKAMNMVSASKLRHARNNLENADDYIKESEVIIRLLAPKESEAVLKPLDPEEKSEDRMNKLLFSHSAPKKMLAIVVTSDRGLCGAFNQSIARLAKSDISQMKTNGIEVKIITIGKKGKEALQNMLGNDIIAHYPNNNITKIDQISDIYQNFISNFNSQDFDSCKIYFNFFKNTSTQIPTIKSLIPLEQVVEPDNNYEYEGESLMENAIKTYLNSQLYHSLLQSKASEEAARMMAMDNATRNAGDMINKLTLSLNRSRQASITTELIEIISGAEAV